MYVARYSEFIIFSATQLVTVLNILSNPIIMAIEVLGGLTSAQS